MKFGKHIQAQQVPGWSAYYLDYKFLKKIISSLAANRPASEAAALALGVRPSDILSSPGSRSPSNAFDGIPGRPPIFSASGQDDDKRPDFRAHKAAFFFKLERELEKINAFYLQKEAELKLRMETLLSKRRAAAMRGLPDTGHATHNHVEWAAVEEGFRLLERDLGKLQQFIEINAIGFRKILKKFDKRSTSTTKELYLARQVDIQPVFNRQLISELSDTVAICLLDLTDLSSGLKFEGSAANDIFMQQILSERTSFTGLFRDLEDNLHKAVASSDSTAIKDCVQYSDVLVQQNGGKTNVSRILWNVIIEAPPDMADLIISLSSPFDFQFIDDINGRTCLHEAAIAGTLRLVNLCIANGVRVDKIDAYGRTALHYASMNGHPNVCRRLLEAEVPPNTLDMDNYTPLVYATLKGSVDCVRVFLEQGEAATQSATTTGDLIPLSLASQSGHVDVVLLMLQYGSKCVPNSNGEYPMHLAAREGHVDVCRLLLHLDGWDTQDKYHEWTPLFHAARYGHEGCVEILLEAGSRVQITDELGHLAVHYAAWYGHQTCLAALLKAATELPLLIDPASPKVASPMSGVEAVAESEIDLIPSLSLPPPIMPHRVYGHNYLDRNLLVQVTIGHSPRASKAISGVRLHHRFVDPAFKDDYLVASAPLKLVMTASPNVNSTPYSISLPQRRGENGIFAFQIPSLDNLSLEFSIYPNFGTKTIGRAVALSSLFSDIENNQAFILPILDNRLHVVGEIAFEVNVITPFQGVTLEVGGDVETYWKSMAGPSSATPQSALSRWPHRSSLIGSAQVSPSTHSITSTFGQALTISSLRGKYIYVVVQVTRDLQPVVFSDWILPESNFDLSVCDITLAQFEKLARRLGRSLEPDAVVTEWPLVSCPMVSLAQLLKVLPQSISVSLELAYPSRQTQRNFSIGRRLDLNVFVDSVLRTIYHVFPVPDAPFGRRRIMFTSFSPDVCSVLNWKQPNYPVFFASRCGRKSVHSPSPTAVGTEDGSDQRIYSVGAAVEFARTNNLLGIFVDADLLIQVPSLINGIRNAGLLVGIHGVSEKSAALTMTSDVDGSPVDVFIGDGIVIYVNHSLQEST